MNIQIYTDGGCSGNPGPGGWAYIILQNTGGGAAPEVLVEKYGAEEDTTNNRMELTAAIAALKRLKALDLAPHQVEVYTDSQYVQMGITEWIHAWKLKGWRSSDKEPVKNQDLWLKLDLLAADFSIAWYWIRGHDGNFYNERCDALTQKAIGAL